MLDNNVKMVIDTTQKPERRIFYVNTGKMPIERVIEHIERIKNEIQQKYKRDKC